MKFLAWLVSIGLLIGAIYKWRYRVMNALLAVGLVRQLVIAITMKLPQFRNKLAPALFGGSHQKS